MLNAIGLNDDFWWRKSDWEIIWIVKAWTFAMAGPWKVGFMVTSWLWQQCLFNLSFINDSSDMPVLKFLWSDRLAHSKCSAMFTVYSPGSYLLITPMPDTEEIGVNETVSGLSELVNFLFFWDMISLSSLGWNLLCKTSQRCTQRGLPATASWVLGETHTLLRSILNKGQHKAMESEWP